MVISSEAEGFSNYILEAFSCGVPVVATNVGGNKEALKHGENGFLYKVGNIRDLADHLLTLMTTERSLKEFRQEVLKSAKEFSIEQNAVAALLERARTESAGATDLFPYTHLLNEHCTREEKLSVLTAMWRVAFADGNIDKYEELLIRRVQDLLRLDHSDFITAKQAARPPQN